MRIYFKRFLSSGTRGFTLIELLVVSLIIVLITSFILFRQQGFNSSTLLRSLAYSVALSVRQAQVYGVSVRETAIGSNSFAAGYGVYIGNTGLADSDHYFVFADKGNGQLDGAGNPDVNSNNVCDTTEDCLVQRYTIGNGRSANPDYTFKNVCAHVSGGSDQCTSGTSPIITNLTIYFRRPNPDACFATSNSTNACTPGATPAYNYDYAYIQLKAAGGSDWRTIKVTGTGQISVCKLDIADVSTC